MIILWLQTRVTLMLSLHGKKFLATVIALLVGDKGLGPTY